MSLLKKRIDGKNKEKHKADDIYISMLFLIPKTIADDKIHTISGRWTQEHMKWKNRKI